MKHIKVVVFGGDVVDRILVRDLGNVLLITTKEEWTAAKQEDREPVTVGFKREYVVS